MIGRLAMTAALALGVGSAQGAPAWSTDPAHSRLTFVAIQAGGEFEGRFDRFTPTIVFDPADLTHSRFSVDVVTASAETGEQDRDNTLKGKDFFASDRWPKAHFEATAFRAAGAAGEFEALGQLTIRDVTRPVRLPFTFKRSSDGRSASLVGGTSIERLAFGVGQGEWSDTQWVGNEVRIHFELALRAASAN